MASYKYKVSVVIPAYNAESTIEKAMKSIPERDDIEIIVVNDGSTDKTASIVRSIGRAILVSHEENYGVASAVNTGIDNTQGEYIVLLGSDDDFYTEEFIKAMEQLDGTDLVYFDLKINDGTIVHLEPSTKETYCGSTKFMRSDFVGDTRNPEEKRAGEDWFFYQELLKKEPTEKFTNLVVKHYNFPRGGSLSWQQRNGLIK